MSIANILLAQEERHYHFSLGSPEGLAVLAIAQFKLRLKVREAKGVYLEEQSKLTDRKSILGYISDY